MNLKAGETRTYRAEWYVFSDKSKCGEVPLSVTLTYEKHPAAGSRAFPGEAVVGYGEIGELSLCHAVSDRGEEWTVYVEGPPELDPMSGCAFGLSADGGDLDEALAQLAARLSNVARWAQTKLRHRNP